MSRGVRSTAVASDKLRGGSSEEVDRWVDATRPSGGTCASRAPLPGTWNHCSGTNGRAGGAVVQALVLLYCVSSRAGLARAKMFSSALHMRSSATKVRLERVRQRWRWCSSP
nr:unnamed protein product [Leishmania braziliensis]